VVCLCKVWLGGESECSNRCGIQVRSLFLESDAAQFIRTEHDVSFLVCVFGSHFLSRIRTERVGSFLALTFVATCCKLQTSQLM
jgi:hypothetical protein